MLGDTWLSPRNGILRTAGLALGRGLEKLSIECACKPVLRRAELGNELEALEFQ